MNKIYTILLLMLIILFGGCEANISDDNTTQERTSDANVTINDINNINNKTNDTSPAFSGKFFNINKDLGISLSIDDNAKYKIYPQNTENWSLDTEVPNVKTTSGIDESRQTSGPVPLILSDGQHTIILEVQDTKGTIYRFEKLFTVDTVSDASVNLNDIIKRYELKPKFTGTSTNIEGTIVLTLSDASYNITPLENGDWSLDTNVTEPTSGTLQLADNKIYQLLINAKDKDNNPIDEIKQDFRPGLLFISSFVYNDNATNNTTADDSINVYFSRATEDSSFQEPHNNFNIEGTGSIGTGSTGFNPAGYFHRYFIDLDGTSIKFKENSTKVYIKDNSVLDNSGFEPTLTQSATTEKFNILPHIYPGNNYCIKDGNSSNVVACSENNTTHIYFVDDNETSSHTIYVNNFIITNIAGDDIVQDRTANLNWQRTDDNTTKTYANAVSYCEGLTYAGKTNWRVPTMQELFSIVDTDLSNPAIDGNFFTNIKSEKYWSSDSYKENNERQWAIDFTYGESYQTLQTNTYYTRCVSSGI